jgi:hypothetical protein
MNVAFDRGASGEHAVYFQHGDTIAKSSGTTMRGALHLFGSIILLPYLALVSWFLLLGDAISAGSLTGMFDRILGSRCDASAKPYWLERSTFPVPTTAF